MSRFNKISSNESGLFIFTEDMLRALVEKGLSTRLIAKENGWSQGKVVRTLKKFNMQTKPIAKNKTVKYCTSCQSELVKHSQKKFCSFVCVADFRWKQKVENILSTKGNTTSETLKKFLKIEFQIYD